MILARMLVGESVRPALQAAGAGSLAAMAAGAGRIAWEAGVVPDLGTWAALVLLAAPATATVLVPGIVGFA
ncbi:MAG: hypothetical protein H0V89_08175, partial [Deltaproteobacteria bacterium]|nr:hypothetical protein [Deltaproteobacteria bacterium]